MALRLGLLLSFWLIATSLCVSYVALTTRPALFGLSSENDDLLRFRDRPLRSWGPYLPRRVPSREVRSSTLPLAQPLAKQAAITKTPQPKLRVPIPPAERKLDSSERNVAAHADTPMPTIPAEAALLGAGEHRLEPALKPSAPKVGKATRAKPSGTKKKVAKRASRKSRGFARGRGVGLFALSGDFGRHGLSQ
jgi:hypothetical protein